jgi:hypothetical protein
MSIGQTTNIKEEDYEIGEPSIEHNKQNVVVFSNQQNNNWQHPSQR